MPDSHERASADADAFSRIDAALEALRGAREPHAEESSVPSVWRQEMQTMLDAGLELQRLAVSLPIGSATREQLLIAAKRWFTKAQLRGHADG